MFNIGDPSILGMVNKIVRLCSESAVKLTALIVLLAFLVPASLALSAPVDREIERLNNAIEEKKEASESAQETAVDLRAELDDMVAQYQEAYGKLQMIDDAVAKKQRELNSVTEQQIYYQNILDDLSIFSYRDGDIYFFEVVLGTSSFKDLIVRLDYLVMLNQRQANILQSTKRLRKMVAERRDELASEKSRQLKHVTSLQEQQQVINKLLQQRQRLIDSLGQGVEALQKQQAEREEYKARLEEEAARQAAFTGRPANFKIDSVFPIPRSYASSYINDWGFARAGNSAGHQGTDIFALKGTPLIAVTDGVISEEFGDSRIGGFRLHIIDSQGVDYYYAHLNNDSPGSDDGLGGSKAAFAPGIAPGTRVRQGQLIGFVGDSGDAEPTPPHLHFSIKVDGEWIRPYPHLKASVYR